MIDSLEFMTISVAFYSVRKVEGARVYGSYVQKYGRSRRPVTDLSCHAGGNLIERHVLSNDMKLHLKAHGYQVGNKYEATAATKGYSCLVT